MNEVSDNIWGASDSDATLQEVANPDTVSSSDESASTSAPDEAAEPVEAAAEETAEPAEVEQEASVDGEETTTEEKPPAPVATPKSKAVTFKFGGKDIALDETATIEHKVDGKKVAIPLKDLITNYAGVVPLNKRFSELDVERKKLAATHSEFENKQKRHSNLLTDMHKNITGGKLFDGVANLLELAGSKVDPRQFVGELRKGLIAQAQQMSQMSEHERALMEEREAREYTQSKYDRIIREQNEQKNQAQHQERVVKAMQSVGATMEEYAEAKQFLEEAKKAGQYTQEITPEVVAKLSKDTKQFGTAKQALVDAGFDPSKEDKLWKHAVSLLELNPEWTIDDLRDVIKQAATVKRGAAASKKLAKAPVSTVVAATAKAKTAPAIAQKQKRESLMLQKPEAYGDFSADDLDW